MRYLIYALIDPRTGETRYVGKSCSGLTRPIQQGKPGVLSRNKRHSGNWIRLLQSQGINFSIGILYQSESPVDLDIAEIYWINEMNSRGNRLTNFTAGGGGRLGNKHSSESKAKISAAHKGRKHSPEHCRNNGLAHKGQDMTKCTEAARVANTGRKMKDRGPEWRAKLSAARKAMKGVKRGPYKKNNLAAAIVILF